MFVSFLGLVSGFDFSCFGVDSSREDFTGESLDIADLHGSFRQSLTNSGSTVYIDIVRIRN